MSGRHPVVARFVNHVWMMDVSVVHSFLGEGLYRAAVFDAFSGSPLAVATYARKGGAGATTAHSSASSRGRRDRRPPGAASQTGRALQ